MNDVKKYLNT